MDDATLETHAPPPNHATPTDGVTPEMLRAEERVQELETEIASKDELVTALTVQLEQLAEQLDRLQRSGADRKRASGGGFPPEMVENQKKIMGDLERVVQQWEDMQAGMMLGRIEVQITELRDFIADRFSGEVGPARLKSSDQGGHFPRLPSSMVLERITVTPAEPKSIELSSDSTSEPAENTSPAAGTSMWESLKSQMLDDTSASATEENTSEPFSEEEPAPPTPLAPSSATSDELETALNERDAYIAFLLRKVRRLTPVQAPPDWVSLENVPEDLCEKLSSNARQLEEHLRLAEIEVSMERARLGREQVQLRHQQEMIEKQMRRLGLKTLDDEIIQTEEVAPADRRWVRFLGLPRGQ